MYSIPGAGSRFGRLSGRKGVTGQSSFNGVRLLQAKQARLVQPMPGKRGRSVRFLP
jgi:hypothetical protein